MLQPKRRPHWVSQFLTKPWEVNEKRELAFFDFAVGDAVRQTPSKRLYREDRLRSAELEERLNKLIETPFSAARATLLATGDIKIDHWPTYRAVVLLVILQAARTQARKAQSDTELAELLASDVEVDQLVQLHMRGRRLVRLGSTLREFALFYPDGGLFGFLTKDTGCLTEWAWAAAVPVTPSVAFATISETADWSWLVEASRKSAHLQAFSFAGPRDARVVLPPNLVEITRSNPSWLIEHREKMNAQREALESLRADALRVFTSRGFRISMRPDRTYCLEGGPEALAMTPQGRTPRT